MKAGRDPQVLVQTTLLTLPLETSLQAKLVLFVSGERVHWVVALPELL